MENERIIVLQIKLGRKHRLFALTLAFICFHPRLLGSETLTLTTYYPAPYGGYVALMTTGGSAANPVNTLLVRDTGRVGIGVTDPDQKLTVAGNISQTGVIISSGAGNNYFAGNVGIGITDPEIYDNRVKPARLDMAGYIATNDVWLKKTDRELGGN